MILLLCRSGVFPGAGSSPKNRVRPSGRYTNPPSGPRCAIAVGVYDLPSLLTSNDFNPGPPADVRMIFPPFVMFTTGTPPPGTIAVVSTTNSVPSSGARVKYGFQLIACDGKPGMLWTRWCSGFPESTFGEASCAKPKLKSRPMISTGIALRIAESGKPPEHDFRATFRISVDLRTAPKILLPFLGINSDKPVCFSKAPPS